jgi:integrase
MASTYHRKDSRFIWIRYRDSSGRWQSKSTGYLVGNPGDRKQAELLAKKQTLIELTKRPIASVSHEFETWVAKWIAAKWGSDTTRGATKRYLNYFWTLLRYLKEKEITQPSVLKREHVIDYLEWRKKHGNKKMGNNGGGGRNTAINEMKFLAQILDEAISRGYIEKNPARKLGIKKDDSAEKVPWSEFEAEQVEKALAESNKFGWMHVTFLMGFYQAVRLRQSQIPLSRIDFQRRIIAYPSDRVKGGKGYSQPIDPTFYPILQELVSHRKSLGKSTLCEIPVLPSVEWRRFLDTLGFKHLVHHGLRATWITRAALAGVPESLAKRFVNHASSQVHAIYQKITATDLMPMLDAFALYRHKQALMPPSGEESVALQKA